MYIYICLIVLIFIALGFILGMKYSNKEIMKMYNTSLKHWRLYEIAIQWIKKQDSIERYIIQKGYKTIGIYGMSHLGDCLAIILKRRGIEVAYGIDRNADRLYNSYVPIYNITYNLPVVDLIVVTTIICFEEIKAELEEKFGKEINIVSLEEILIEE